MNKPTHIAYVVTEGRRGGKASWHEIGAVWPHKQGGGFDLVIHDQLNVSGRIVVTTRKEKNARLTAAAPELLDVLEELVERDRAEAAASGFTDAEMTWLENARRVIAEAKGGAA